MAAAASAPVLVSSSGAGTGYHRGCMNKGRGGQTEQHFFEYKKVVVSSAGGFSFCFLSPASFFLPFFTHVFLGGLRWQEGRSNKFRALIFVMTKRVTPWTRVRPPLVLDGLLVRIPIDINVNNLRARRIHTNLNANSCIRQSRPRHRELVHIQRFADGTRYNSDDRRSPPVEPQVG